MMTRDEHLQWCKDRALKYLDEGDLSSAFASFCSDWGKHPEFKAGPPLIELGVLYITRYDNLGMRRWIEGFR